MAKNLVVVVVLIFTVLLIIFVSLVMYMIRVYKSNRTNQNTTRQYCVLTRLDSENIIENHSIPNNSQSTLRSPPESLRVLSSGRMCLTPDGNTSQIAEISQNDKSKYHSDLSGISDGPPTYRSLFDEGHIHTPSTQMDILPSYENYLHRLNARRRSSF